MEGTFANALLSQSHLSKASLPENPEQLELRRRRLLTSLFRHLPQLDLVFGGRRRWGRRRGHGGRGRGRGRGWGRRRGRGSGLKREPPHDMADISHTDDDTSDRRKWLTMLSSRMCVWHRLDKTELRVQFRWATYDCVRVLGGGVALSVIVDVSGGLLDSCGLIKRQNALKYMLYSSIHGSFVFTCHMTRQTTSSRGFKFQGWPFNLVDPKSH